MLHILWLIIKWILIILGIVFGLLLLAVFLVLFCPVRYRIKAYKPEEGGKETVEVSAGISWLFRGIVFNVFYENGQLKKALRIFGISFEKFRRKKKKSGQLKEERRKEQEALPEKQDNYVKECEKPYSDIRIEEQKEGKEVPQMKKKKPGLLKKIVGKIKSIPFKIRKIRLTIQKTCVKIEWWKSFFSNTKVREGITVFWKDIKKLLRHISPVKVEGMVRFGCEDPSVTGKVTAFLGMCIPFSKNCIQVIPVFQTEQNILEGNVKIKGRLYGVVLLKTAVKIFFDKNIKYVISQWKRKEV